MQNNCNSIFNYYKSKYSNYKHIKGVNDLEGLLSIDTEDFFHAEYVKRRVTDRCHRAVSLVPEVLKFLDNKGVKATFFVVGEVFEKYPQFLEQIEEKGHEIAFHGYTHTCLEKLTPKSLQEEIDKFNSILRLTSVEKPLGFRAPSLSLNNNTKWALKVLQKNGFVYDSSICPTKTILYGVSKAPIRPYKVSFEDVSKEDKNGKMWEFPVLIYQLPLINFRIPMTGGFYLRFFPIELMKKAIKKINAKGYPGLIYTHTWEICSDHVLSHHSPKINLGFFKSFVTYYNIKKSRKKLENLLSSFKFTSIKNYIEKNKFLE